MSVVTWIRKKSNLSRLVDQAGGMSVRSALSAAAENLEPLREGARARVERRIARLERVLERRADDRAGLLSEVYAEATGILDCAGPFGMDDLCTAAFSLCELADRYDRSNAPVDLRGFQVHVRALRLLHQLDRAAPDARKPVLEGLQRVLDRVSAD